jgi:predicted NUDIX family NTP pyrophosphohydrolase
MAKRSAGLIMFRWIAGHLEVFLVHPGGPFWAKKDSGVWSIPKGEYSGDEVPLAAALREFEEETGLTLPSPGELIPLEDIQQPGGKIVTAWGFEGDCEASKVRSNTFSMEWPPKSGSIREFPEIDRAEWFSIKAARSKLLKGQLGFLDQLVSKLKAKAEELSSPSGV